MQSLRQAREAANAQSAALSHGVTAYHVAGDDGPWVVLVHGLVTPSYAWEPLSEAIAAQGFRVLRYDQYGRGLSDRPRVAYDLDLYVGQLRELADTLGIERTHLIGWSMGALMVTRLAAECPERAESIALIAPGLYASGSVKVAAQQLLRLPGVRKLVASRVGDVIDRLPQQHMSRPERFPDYSERAREQLRFPGMAESFASTVANYPARAGDQWAGVGEHPRPVLVVWGTDDAVTPYANRAQVQRLYPRSELLAVEGARHAPHLDHPEIVHPAILRHLAAARNRS
ncbi:alpha/beta fold hydrolase [Mycobacterium sp. TY815]|uniref:alpha/beta fold hydrolase n=1 Tax=Mycobacterium sp. TY815 TaxID=3050581 RepID=UPI002741F48B|nr:alpha/beta hydrolase [Mycobacterium sp. TY815]MDP7703761.1 alpha/beta hydrolase [Mycobacterium sp. TY815]